MAGVVRLADIRCIRSIEAPENLLTPNNIYSLHLDIVPTICFCFHKNPGRESAIEVNLVIPVKKPTHTANIATCAPCQVNVSSTIVHYLWEADKNTEKLLRYSETEPTSLREFESGLDE